MEDRLAYAAGIHRKSGLRSAADSGAIDLHEKLCSRNWVCAILPAPILDRQQALRFSSAS
jgi:hypothetical protein